MADKTNIDSAGYTADCTFDLADLVTQKTVDT